MLRKTFFNAQALAPEGSPSQESHDLPSVCGQACKREGLSQRDGDCVKSPLRCHPRESGDPYPSNINWILAESSTTLRVIDPWGVFDPLSWE